MTEENLKRLDEINKTDDPEELDGVAADFPEQPVQQA